MIHIYTLCFNNDFETSFYVGQTSKELTHRLASHRRIILKRLSAYSFLNSISDYKSVTIFHICDCISENAQHIEFLVWQSLLELKFNIQNRDPLAGWKSRKGAKLSNLTKQKISVKLKGRIFSSETIAKRVKAIRDKLKNKKLSQEHREKISIALRGKKHSEEAKIKISIGNKKKRLPIEQKQKISLALLGKPLNDVTKEKISAALKGIKRSQATKDKISASQKLRHLQRKTNGA